MHNINDFHKIILKTGAWLALLLFHINGYAQNSEAFISKVEAAIQAPLPQIETIIPGYQKPRTPPQTLLVGDFTTNSDDGYDWGRAIGRVIRWDLHFMPTIQLRMPDYNTFYQDAFSKTLSSTEIGRSRESLLLAANRLGISTLVEGEIHIEQSDFSLQASMTQAQEDSTSNHYHYSGNLDELPDALSTLTRAILDDLNISEPTYNNRYSPLSLNELRQAAWLYSDQYWTNKDEGIQQVKQLWQQGSRILPLTASYLYYLPVENNLPHYHQQLDEVSDKFPQNSGIDFAVARYMGYNNDTFRTEKLSRLKQLIRDNPADPTMMLALNDMLADIQFTHEALSISIESLQRWPDNYRTWWSFSWTLSQHAWLIRGPAYWDELSPRAKQLFPALMQLAQEAADTAIMMNPENADLWVQKLSIADGYSREMLSSFYQAIELDPQNRRAYENALRYSAARWGGSYFQQRKIYELARKNIYDSGWLNHIESYYIDEPGIMESLIYKIAKVLELL